MNWKKVKLGDICSFVESGSRPKGGVDDNGDVPSLGAEHLDEKGGFNFTKLKLVSNEFFEKMSKGIIKEQDILLVKDGATTGKVSYVNIDFVFKKACINEHVFRIEINKEKAFSRYVFFHLYSPVGKKQILNDFRGATVGGISKGFIDMVEIPLPDLATQKHIAEILDKADAIRQQNRALLAQYDELLQSTFIELFGNGENLRNLSDITTKITDGVHSKPQYTESGIPFISVKNITNLFLDFKDCKYISKEDHEQYCKRCKPELNDILYTKVGATYGRAAIVNTDEEFSLYVSVALIKPKVEIIEPKYLLAVLNTDFVKRQADKSIKGAGVPDLHLIEIKKFKIPVPPFHLQQHFAKIVGQIEAQKEQAKKAMEEGEALFEGLLAKYFN